MTTIYNDSTAFTYPTPSRHEPMQFVRNVVKRLDGWLDRQAIRSELQSLDDRTLADLGLNRGDFPAIVGGTFQHPRDK